MAMEEEWTGYDGGAVQEWHRNASRIRVASGVTVIPDGAFAWCPSLRAVDLCNVATISTEAFYNCLNLERVVWTKATRVEIGNSAFDGCQSLGEIDLSNTTKIGEKAFMECNELNRVAIPSSVASADVELGEGIQRIGKKAFYSCGLLARINIPSSVTDIDDSAFEWCVNMEEVGLNEGLQLIGARAFARCASLCRISIHSTVSKVGKDAFCHCHQLRYAELQEGLQMIGAGAFRDCQSLERITVPSSTIRIGGGAFGFCSNLSEVTLTEGIHCIDSGAFDNCRKLEHINIPPVAFVIDIRGRNCQLMRSTMPVPQERTVVASKWLQYRGPGELEQAEAKVNEILARDERTEEEKIASIRGWFAYLDMLDVTTMLELAIWRANMNENEQDSEARKASRQLSGSDMNVIIPAVLLFLGVRYGSDIGQAGDDLTNDDSGGE